MPTVFTSKTDPEEVAGDQLKVAFARVDNQAPHFRITQLASQQFRLRTFPFALAWKKPEGENRNRYFVSGRIVCDFDLQCVKWAPSQEQTVTLKGLEEDYHFSQLRLFEPDTIDASKWEPTSLTVMCDVGKRYQTGRWHDIVSLLVHKRSKSSFMDKIKTFFSAALWVDMIVQKRNHRLQLYFLAASWKDLYVAKRRRHLMSFYMASCWLDMYVGIKRKLLLSNIYATLMISVKKCTCKKSKKKKNKQGLVLKPQHEDSLDNACAQHEIPHDDTSEDDNVCIICITEVAVYITACCSRCILCEKCKPTWTSTCYAKGLPNGQVQCLHCGQDSTQISRV